MYSQYENVGKANCRIRLGRGSVQGAWERTWERGLPKTKQAKMAELSAYRDQHFKVF